MKRTIISIIILCMLVSSVQAFKFKFWEKEELPGKNGEQNQVQEQVKVQVKEKTKMMKNVEEVVMLANKESQLEKYLGEFEGDNLCINDEVFVSLKEGKFVVLEERPSDCYKATISEEVLEQRMEQIRNKETATIDFKKDVDMHWKLQVRVAWLLAKQKLFG